MGYVGFYRLGQWAVVVDVILRESRRPNDLAANGEVARR
jgi:hypothetical protein